VQSRSPKSNCFKSFDAKAPELHGKGRKVCQTNKSQYKLPLPLLLVNIARVVVAEVAVKVAPVVEADAAKADPEVPVDRAGQVAGLVVSGNISARRKSASSVSRRWT
jgi:hypothetical protein